MVRKVAPTKVTGGGGFEFEDKVTAFFMCHLLLSRPPLDSAFGTITKISLQVRADGWLLDDLLLQLKDNGNKTFCAFSIKSNTQFSKTSAPSEFVQDAWEQYLGEVESNFNKGRDRLGIITTPLDTKTKSDIEGLLNKARIQDTKELAKRIAEEGYVSKEAGSLFKSFSCPDSITKKYSVDETLNGDLLRHVEHLEFDFEETASKDKVRAIGMLKDILANSSLDDAENLWDSLCAIARSTRGSGGDVDLESLVGKIRGRYKLKDFPDYAPDWAMIKQKTKDALDLIPDKISDNISIDRSTEIAKLIDKLDTKRTVVLLGESGCGKTVIEKAIVKSESAESKVVWISTETAFVLQGLRSWDIFKLVTDKSALLVIDGIDRFNDNDLKELALLLKACSSASEASPWRIIISSQPDDWARVQYGLSRLNVKADFEHDILKNPDYESLTPVWDKYPSLRSLSLHEHLRSFLFKPKVLDLFARKIEDSGAFDAQALSNELGSESKIGESHLISWYWEQEIEQQENGLKKSVLLKLIAERLADELTNDILADDFTPEEIGTIQELTLSRILISRDDKISFEHDLIADWARLRKLLDKSSSASNYLEDRLSSPLWCRALRLLGTHKLEMFSGIDDWMKLFESFSVEGKEDNLAQDLLLEASVFSSDLKNNLDKLWGKLTANNGELLRRLLKRFQYSASFPNKIALLIAHQYQDESISELIAQNRDPYWVYWLPMIQYLHTHKEEATNLAKRQLAEIVDRWLRFSKKDWPVRKEAAEIAIEIAEDELALNLSTVINIDQNEMVKYAYRAGIAAYTELPDQVTNFVLTACSRQAPSGRISERVKFYNEKTRKGREKHKRPVHKKTEIISPTFPVGPIPDPWPDGPIVRVDHDFHNLCLESQYGTDILNPIIINDPNLSYEILLALLIEEPTPRDRYGSKLNEYTGMTYVSGWFPPFFTRGPFYSFLHAHPGKGLDLIIRLVNFATERWAEDRVSEDREAPHIEIELPAGRRKFVGDANVYYWHRDVGQVSHIIPSALMALEKWLYDAYDKEETKEKVVSFLNRILENGTSLAFIGLLISIGKKNPELFLNTLLPLLSIPEIYDLDIEHIVKSEGHQGIGWFREGEFLTKASHEFNSMDHRKYSISIIAPRIFIMYSETRELFSKYRSSWIKRYESGDLRAVPDDVFINLIHWFDISNYSITEVSGGTQFEFNMPKEIAKEREAGLKDIQDRQLLISSPLNFRMILDGKTPIDELEATQIWDTIQRAARITLSADDPDLGEKQRDNAVCGGIAVLFKYYGGWLKDNSENRQWCIEKIMNLILNPHPDDSFDSDVSHANWFWDRFCAEIMPILWAEEPENYEYKQCIAALALNKHYETVGILTRTASEVRDKLNQYFMHLLNLIIFYSYENRPNYYSGPSEGPPLRSKVCFALASLLGKIADNKTNDIQRRLTNKAQSCWKKHDDKAMRLSLDGLVAKFITGSLPSEIRIFDTNQKSGEKLDQIRVNTYLLKTIFGWMPTLDKALNQIERREWVLFWGKSVRWTIDNLNIKEDGEYSGTPSDWDRWIFEQMATQLLHIEDNENPNSLWQPIINMGAEGHYWVDDFIFQLFMKGIGYESISANFTKRWKEILEYAFDSEKWSPARSRYWFHRNKLWCELLGMGYLTSNLWDIEKSYIIKEMNPYYARWARDFLPDSESAEYFIHFLQKPAAIDILLDALIWLDNASDTSGEAFFTDRHHDVQKPLANLLEISWKKHNELIKGNVMAHKAYKGLLKKLIGLQNLQAIEIQKNLLI
ncbi:hypothetical protein KAR91_72305 [Candidatus Pacearchaeota archaeon]|nr:hypothetical protein [Candidatus Pacearchaeota archaeon]